ncbi:hypothetical protein QFC21_003092 [Naganishia friedmannii]|uniref:Uncharacterized protein n=1 Tax=Naganishia friedmannii TaxID=89922 RepID=A0ACC2VQS2_9TREE|nr:hypothetical protein QFC21_003092 [Naganishia friedmannii]
MAKEQRYFLCVDVGGSKTAASIADLSGSIVGRGYAGSANLAEVRCWHSQSVGGERCFARIQQAVNQAAAAVTGKSSSVDVAVETKQDVSSLKFEDIWVGIAGCDTTYDQRKIEPLLTKFFQRPITPMNDALLLSSHALLTGSTHSVALVVGTGSVIIGLELQKTTKPVQLCRKGGNGHLLGDHGSAARMAADDFNMGLSTTSDPTYASLCEHYGVSDPGHLPAKIHELDLSLDAITASNKRKLLISDSAPIILCAVAPQSNGSTFPTSSSDDKTLAWRVITCCVDTIATDIHDVFERMQSLVGSELKADQMALGMTGGIIARPAFRKMLMMALEQRSIRFNDSTFIENAADHGAASLSRAFGRRTP